jgi:hypothetical protein
VNAHLTEVVPKAGFHKGACHRVHRRTRRAHDAMHQIWGIVDVRLDR